MACLDMYNSEHKTGHHRHHHHHHHHHHFAPAVSPRISFSNDFVDAQQALKQEMIRSSLRSDQTAQVSSDFEFSVSNYSMMSGADELFFKGRLLPFKDTNNNNTSSSSTNNTTSSQRVTTLREELLAVDDDDVVTFRPPKGSSSSSSTTRWKSLLGLNRAHIGSNSKKAAKSDLEAHVSKSSQQDLLNEGGSSNSCRDDVEIGI
ncbi:hypothetical protein TIFTF001_002688 [Ficus carica]|uniref:Uncharacterized protein n=1 Tax=Ficus carica TaxID=3494 RepID=A0AA88CU72_FICCA|nr:hypothetical protein TIFTF001_002688 [Ficus carica]